MQPAVIFDDGLGVLAPLTDLRPCFGVRTGALTTLDRLRLALGLEVVGLRVPEAIADLTREQFEVPVNAPPSVTRPTMLVNGRCVRPHGAITALQPGEGLVEAGSGHLVAAMCPPGDLGPFFRGETVSCRAVSELPAPALLARPWHFRTFRDEALALDLRLLGDANRNPADAPPPPPPGVTVLGEHRLTIHDQAHVYPGVILDAEQGPIVIGAGAVVRPGATIIGPACIGHHSTVIDRAFIKSHTAIGPHCKVAGEVGGCLFQGYANKAHDGHLGDSWIGQWANLGAGTTNSNLLNTYDEVIARAAPDQPDERTGQMFLGCIVGDHVKFAIVTRIMTGAVIHTGAMIAASAPVSGCVPPFAWMTDAPPNRRYRLDKFLSVARTVMARRNVEASEAYLKRIAVLHAGTGPEHFA